MGEYFNEYYAYITNDLHPVLSVFMVGTAIMSKTTSVSALTLFACVCTVICFEVGAMAKRLKSRLEINNYFGNKRLIFKYREQYEQIVDLVKVTNDILGKCINI